MVENLLDLFVDQAGPLAAGDHVVPHCNAMASPFVHRLLGPIGAQQIVTWELRIGGQSLALVARDHLSRRNVAQALIPRATQPLAGAAVRA